MASQAPANHKEDAKEAKTVAKPLNKEDPNDSKLIVLVSNDGKRFELDRESAKISTLVATCIENDLKAESIPFPAVTGTILELVVQYMRNHKGVEPPIIEKPLKSKLMSDVCPNKFDAAYIDKVGETRQTLYDLILAANFCDIKSLLHLGCAKVASLIKGESLEKIKQILDPQGKGFSSKDSKTDSKDAEEERMKID